MMEVANRLSHIKEYYFSRKLKEVRALAAAGNDIINMGIGSPDLPAPQSVVTALKESLVDPKAHQYQSYIGLPELREAIVQFYANQYTVALDATHEILPLMGSKEGIMHISMAFLNPGDQVLIPNPGYPTYSAVTKLVEAVPVPYDLTEENNWLPDLDALGKQDLRKVKLMWINYPHMPTGAQAQKGFYEEVIAFAKANNIILINDNPYSFILNDAPLSILQIDGAKEVALELNSLSKTFNMAGWRVGMVSGKAALISSILKVKSNMDSGMFYGIQQGAIAALQLDKTWFEKINAIYTRRRLLVFKLAEKLGCTFDTQGVGLFVWAKLPQGINAEEFIDRILLEKSIFITPGTIFGSQGKGYIRFSLCVTEERIQEAIERISNE